MKKEIADSDDSPRRPSHHIATALTWTFWVCGEHAWERRREHSIYSEKHSEDVDLCDPKNSAFSDTFLESTKICQFTNIYTKKPKSYSSRAPPAVRSFSYFLPFLCVWFSVWIHIY